MDMQAIHEKVQEQSKFVDAILGEAGKVIVGQRRMLEHQHHVRAGGGQLGGVGGDARRAGEGGAAA